MGKVLTLVVLFVSVLVGVTLYLCPCLLRDPKIPDVPSHRWWGPGHEPPGGSETAADIRPFYIQVTDDELIDLKDRLRYARLSTPLEGVAFQYGFNTDYLRTILDYWLNKYDWRREEARLNQFPQFITKIEGIDVHFIHVKPALQDKKVKVLPLLMIHGWPGSVVEFYKIIPLLTSGVGGVAFEIICPSIPGFGFSEAPHHPGYSPLDAGRTFKKLMEALGHRQFYVQGGDWGSYIGSMMSIFYPDRVRGLHLNFSPLPFNIVPAILKYIAGHVAPSLIMDVNQKFNIFPFKEYFSNLLLESGYFHIQATKPDTVGVALGDSPIGLAAYILEKFSTATNMDFRERKDGGLLEKFTLDELLTNVMVYWVTNTATSSIRLYKENMKPSQMALKLDALPIMVPTGLAVFPHEIMTTPRSILSHKYRQILTYNLMKRGGHFAALEEPELLADDIRAFVSACETHIKEQEVKSKAESIRTDTKTKNKQATPTKKQAQEKNSKTERRLKEEKVIKQEAKTATVNAEKQVKQAPTQKQEEVKIKVTKLEKKTTTTKTDGNVNKPTTPSPPKSTTTKTDRNDDKPETQSPPKPTTTKIDENVDKPTTQPPKATTTNNDGSIGKPTTQSPPKPTTTSNDGNVDKPTTKSPPKPTTPVTPKHNSETEKPKEESTRIPSDDHTIKPPPKEQPSVKSETAKPELKETQQVKASDDSVKPSTSQKETSGSAENKMPNKEPVSDQKTNAENVPPPKVIDENVVPIEKTEKVETIGMSKTHTDEGIKVKKEEHREKPK